MLDVLSHDDHARVTVLTALPGSGKTTALACWAATRDHPDDVAWVEAGADHRDRGRWFQLATLRAVAALVPRRTLPDPSRVELARGVPATAQLDSLLAAIDDRRRRGWLVLEDLHLLGPRPASWQLLQALVDRAPAALHVVLTSRSDLPLDLDRVRARGWLRTLTGSDLAFTPEETVEVLSRQLGAERLARLAAAPARPEDETSWLTGRRAAGWEGEQPLARWGSQLHRRTGGWPAGVRLAGLLLAEDATEPDLTSVDGDAHLVADYLGAELMSTLPAPDRALLEELSPAADITVELARTLSDHPDPASFLERAAREQLLVTRIGDHPPVYRCNELLRSYLAAELRRRDLGRWRRQQARLAHWEHQRGRAPRALEHAIAADDPELMAQLLPAAGAELLINDEDERLGQLLGQLPDAVAGGGASTLLQAHVALRRGDLAAAETLMLACRPTVGDDPAQLALLRVLELLVERAHGSAPLLPDVPDEQLAEALVACSGDPSTDLLVLRARSSALIRAGRADLGLADLERLGELAAEQHRAPLAVWVLTRLGSVAGLTGDLTSMRVTARRALALAEPRGWGGSGLVTHAHLQLATLGYLDVDPDRMRHHLTAAAGSLEPTIDADSRLVLELAQGHLELERAPDPRRVLARIRRLWPAPGAGDTVAPTRALWGLTEVRRCLEVGERGWAEQATQQLARSSVLGAEAAVATALLELSAGRLDQAWSVLRPVLDGTPSVSGEVTRTRAQVLAAELSLVACEGPDAAARWLRAAEASAARHHLVRPFVEVSPRLHRMLTELAPELGPGSPVTTALTRPAPIVLPLLPGGLPTPSELALLHDLASPETLARIAEDRSLSLNTVKTHLRSLYRKLGVDNRHDAVRAAGQLGLR